MKQPMRPVVLAAATLWIVAPGVLAQQPSGGRTVVVIDESTPASEVEAFDARVERLIGDGTLRLTSVTTDRDRSDRTHEAFAQVYQGVPVVGGELTRQRAGERTVSAFGTIFENVVAPVQPALSAATATTLLGQRTSAAVVEGGAPTLAVLPRLDGSYRLAWSTTLADGTAHFVDADTGQSLEVRDAFLSQSLVGTGVGVHGDTKKVSATRSAGGFESRDGLRPAEIITRSAQGTTLGFSQLVAGGSPVATDADNAWSNPAVVDAHVNAGLTYDYFYEYMGWQGLDSQNGTITQVVADRSSLDSNAVFVFPPLGPGGRGIAAFGATSAGIPLTPLDVVGHELMHGAAYFGIHRRTGRGPDASLVPDGLGPVVATYQGDTFPCSGTTLQVNGAPAPFFCVDGRYALVSSQSGAVHEAFSDVIGTGVEHAHQPRGSAPLRADYTLGEDVSLPGVAPPSGLIRSLENPGAYTVDPQGQIPYPDHADRRVRFTLVVVDNVLLAVPWTIVNGAFVWTGTVDSGGVHMNATVFSHAYYLAVEGGQNRTSGGSVVGVGAGNRGQIERIFFRTMTEVIPASSTFIMVASALRQSAADLYGTSSAAFRAIDQALTAVGL